MRTASWIILAAALALAALAPGRLSAFNQPPANLAATTFLDGGGAPPGAYLVEYAIFTDGSQARDRDGNGIAGGGRVSSLTLLNQLFFLTPWQFLKGQVGFDVLLPWVSVSAQGSLGPFPLTTNMAGPGDLLIGPALQWNDSSLLGKPFLHRFELDVTLPTGMYDKNFAANPGSNLWVVEPYYAVTWMFADAWESSARIFYAFHGKNPATQIQPGQLLHMNVAASYAAHPRLRLGAAGYYLQQTTEDRVAGAASSGSKERAFAAGPGLAYHGQGLTLMLSVLKEFGVRNRFSGTRSTLELIHRF